MRNTESILLLFYSLVLDSLIPFILRGCVSSVFSLLQKELLSEFAFKSQ